MKIIEIEQGTTEWFHIRKGKMTASKADCIYTGGKTLNTYVFEIMAEKLSSNNEEKYTNEAMERGKLLESEARTIYELESGNTAKEVGFCLLDDNDYVGCSPDGLVNNDGLVEIKCPTDRVYLRYLYDEEVDKKYYAQMQMQMYVTDRKWCDYVVYNPGFKQNIVIKRINRDEVFIEKLKQGIKDGIEIIKNIERKLNDK
jgi:putative phage-type endonuclease